jgi:hypothetical protein
MIPLAALAQLVTEQNIESVLLKTLLERFVAARVEPLCGEKTLTAAETTATNEPALIPEPPLQPPVNTNLPFTTSKIPPLIKMNPATSSPSKTFLTSTVRTAVNKISSSKDPSRYPIRLSRCHRPRR